jgi:hypothetical protein
MEDGSSMQCLVTKKTDIFNKLMNKAKLLGILPEQYNYKYYA